MYAYYESCGPSVKRINSIALGFSCHRYDEVGHLVST